MMTLYDYLPSQNAWKVRLLCSHLSLTYRTEIVSIFEGHGQTPEYLAISPTGAVPALKLADGRCIAESNAILLYLAENTRYLPADAYTRGKINQWLFFEGEQVQSTVATLRHWRMTGKDANRSAEILESKHQGSLKTLRILDSALQDQPFLAGAEYTIADMSVFAYVHLAHEADLPVQQYVNIMRWIDAVRSQPGFLQETHPYATDPHSHRELPA